MNCERAWFPSRAFIYKAEVSASLPMESLDTLICGILFQTCLEKVLNLPTHTPNMSYTWIRKVEPWGAVSWAKLAVDVAQGKLCYR